MPGTGYRFVREDRLDFVHPDDQGGQKVRFKPFGRVVHMKAVSLVLDAAAALVQFAP